MTILQNPYLRIPALTLLTMVAFAGNSILCRLALRETAIDAATFTAVRILSGAAILMVIVSVRRTRARRSWPSAAALFIYAAAFSYAYIALTTGTGALLLFGAVQITMVVAGLRAGETMRPMQVAGLGLAAAGLVYLVSPGLAAPPRFSAVLMLAAGVAWGAYSLRGRNAPNPTAMTAGNFSGASLLALVLIAVTWPWIRFDAAGVMLGIASGSLASGLGYVLWYTVLPSLRALRAASVQLSVPVLAAVGGTLFLDEAMTIRLMIASVAILGGIYLVIRKRHRANPIGKT